MDLWQVPREWPGETVFILGGGPSLAKLDLNRLRGRRVIVINRTFQLAPFADVLYFCDRHYWTLDKKAIVEKFQGKYIITISRCDDPLVKNIRNDGTAGLSTDPHGVKHGSNSGYQAINVAFHFGVSRIVLLGYDMKIEGDRTHAHAGYGTPAPMIQHVLQQRMLPFFPRLVEPLAKAGVEVLNGNPDSALDCWPKISPDDALNLQ